MIRGVQADTTAQLAAVARVELHSYDFVDAWKRKANLDEYAGSAVGVMAQDLKKVIPGSVKNTGVNYDLDDGSHVRQLRHHFEPFLALSRSILPHPYTRHLVTLLIGCQLVLCDPMLRPIHVS